MQNIFDRIVSPESINSLEADRKARILGPYYPNTMLTREIVKEEYLIIILGYFFLFFHKKHVVRGYSLEVPQ